MGSVVLSPGVSAWLKGALVIDTLSGVSSGYALRVNGSVLASGDVAGRGFSISRGSAARCGYNFYNETINAWQVYMGQATIASQGYLGNLTPPAGTLVTAWALRSLIEPTAGYGWTFETIANGGSGATAIKAEIRASDGSAWFGGSLSCSSITCSGSLTIINPDGGSSCITGGMAASDNWFIGGRGSANAGYLEISVGDDGQSIGTAEAILVRQYGPGQAPGGTVARTAYLLDSSGNTSFPGSLSCSSISCSGSFTGYGSGNDYHTGGVSVNGNGTTNTVFPTVGFHQPAVFASSIQLRAAGDFRFYAQGAGSYAAVTASSFSASSARSQKQDINPYLESALSLLSRVEIVNYRYKIDPETPHIGFIADDTPVELSGTNQDMMSLSDCIGVLIKAVQELAEKVGA